MAWITRRLSPSNTTWKRLNSMSKSDCTTTGQSLSKFHRMRHLNLLTQSSNKIISKITNSNSYNSHSDIFKESSIKFSFVQTFSWGNPWNRVWSHNHLRRLLMNVKIFQHQWQYLILTSHKLTSIVKLIHHFVKMSQSILRPNSISKWIRFNISPLLFFWTILV